MGRGEQILEVLVDAESEGLYGGSTHLLTIARRIEWASDGRSVRPTLRRLEMAELIEQHHGSGCVDAGWRPTPRGREVDAILRRITAARGGSFVPRNDAGISFGEAHALR